MMNFVNQLIKYSISTELKSLGFIPFIVGKNNNDFGISFLNITTNLEIIIDFLDFKKNDNNILMMNCDQTWKRLNDDFYNIAFLNFTKKLKIQKFDYAVSWGIPILEIKKKMK